MRHESRKAVRVRREVGDLETSVHRNQVRLLAQDDPQEARAVELEAAGLDRFAPAVRLCGRFGPFGARYCRYRLCPGCAARRSRENAERFLLAIRGMKAPATLVATFSTLGPWDLAAAVHSLRASLVRIRRHRSFASVRAVGSIETKRASAGVRWNVHAHLVIDPGSVDSLSAARAWHVLTDGRGTLQQDPSGPVRDVAALAWYIAKADGWCPPPGVLSAKELELLHYALRSRQLTLSWGATARARVTP